MKNMLNRSMNYVSRHKVAIAAGTVAATVIVIQHVGIMSLNAFLEEKNLTNEYYPQAG